MTAKRLAKLAVDDRNLRERAKAYIETQMALMDRHGQRPDLSRDSYEKLLWSVMQPMMQLRQPRVK